MAMQRRCGEEFGQFYDCDGYYFREGVDPRNNFGRFSGTKETAKISRVDKTVYWLSDNNMVMRKING